MRIGFRTTGHREIKMQEDPVYDFPEPAGESVGERRACPQRGSLKNISVLDRLLFTHSVWLQLSINSATALHILQREPPGTFLVRKSNTLQKKVLCVRLMDESVPSFVKQFSIREVESTFSLERAALSFPDLCRLIAFYCVSRDVLPFPLQLPEAIVRASSQKELKSIAHMGVEFWSSPLNFRGPRSEPAPAPAEAPPSPTVVECATHQGCHTLFQEFCPIQTRSPRELNCGAAGHGALCFINPLFLELQPKLHRRHQFKHSIKVRVSTENSSALSPPVTPPPPPPLLAKKKAKKAQQASEASESKGTGATLEASDYSQVHPTLPKKTRAVPTLSPTVEDDYHVPLGLLPTVDRKQSGEKEGVSEEEGHLSGVDQEKRGEEGVREEASLTPGIAQEKRGEEEVTEEEVGLLLGLTQEKGVEKELLSEEKAGLLPGLTEPNKSEKGVCEEEVGLLLEQKCAPSLSEMDSSSSLSSLDEVEDTSERPPVTRGASNPSPPGTTRPRQPLSALRQLSAAFVSFFVPEKRVARLVEDLSRDRRTAFGALVQDFLSQQREAVKPQYLRSAVELLQGIRLFLSQAKAFLLDCRELEPPIETMLSDDDKDLVLEKALLRCVLKPLKGQVDRTLKDLHERDGSSQKMAECLARARGTTLSDGFGVRVGVPDGAGVEKVRRKLILMIRAYSPINKVMLLLQACKLIYKAMTENSGQEFGADDFLPALSYVLVQCDMPELMIEVEYMMELLEFSYLTGEGGYYLTSVYASLHLIQSMSEAVPSGGLTQEARDSLKNWSRRRSSQVQKNLGQHLKCLRILFQDGDQSCMKTLQWKAGDNVENLIELCAAKFGVDNPQLHKLYLRNEGKLQECHPQALIQDVLGHGCRQKPLVYQQDNQDVLETYKLTREGAVDLEE
ncbi:hypothetical protein DPEC_G00236030 [Dallia pectoralis]|uniref:Uncharacterized protein n=1 Tax=Dallia pectoralis TaxID=75939 RepID=A0ACC2FYM1_DALPE|nr:hypothetical protein DPEC_G00236030 [Dallia pectoralis]